MIRSSCQNKKRIKASRHDGANRKMILWRAKSSLGSSPGRDHPRLSVVPPKGLWDNADATPAKRPCRAGTTAAPGNSPLMGIADIEAHPLTGRFLMGRLRHAMTAEEKDIVESLVEQTEPVPAGTTLLGRGELGERST